MTWEIIAAVAGGIVLITSAGSALYKWIHPILEVKDTVEELDRRTKTDYDALKRIEETLERIETVQRMLIGSELSIMNHLIDGNDREKMKETRDKIQAMLVEDN